MLLIKDTIDVYVMSGLSIYALKLENGKYYVGRSYNVPKRLNQHYNGEGSVWTKKHKPIKLNEVFLNKTKFDEDKYTLMYMSIYGIENVRGGSFCSQPASMLPFQRIFATFLRRSQTFLYDPAKYE